MSIPAESVIPASHALCATHPDEAAIGTCARCGRFVCGECRTDSALCTACVALEVSALPALQPRASKAVGLLYAHVGIELLLVILSIGLLVFPGDDPLLVFAGLAGVLLILTYCATIVFYLRWLHLAVRTVNARGENVGVTPGWAVGWWFIPFANLVKPYHTVRALVAATGGEAAVSRARVGLWWTAWVIGNVLANIESRMNVSHSDGFQSASTVLSIASSVFAIISAWLCVGVIRAVGDGLRR